MPVPTYPEPLVSSIRVPHMRWSQSILQLEFPQKDLSGQPRDLETLGLVREIGCVNH